MTWKPHWCHQAQEIAQQNGWTVHEIAGGVMVFRTADHEHEIPIDLSDANALALSADRRASDAIAKAAAAMPAKEDAGSDG